MKEKQKYYRAVADKLYHLLRVGGQYEIQGHVCKMINAADRGDYRTATEYMDLALDVVPVSWGTALKNIPKPQDLEQRMLPRGKPGTYLRIRRRKG